MKKVVRKVIEISKAFPEKDLTYDINNDHQNPNPMVNPVAVAEIVPPAFAVPVIRSTE